MLCVSGPCGVSVHSLCVAGALCMWRACVLYVCPMHVMCVRYACQLRYLLCVVSVMCMTCGAGVLGIRCVWFTHVFSHLLVVCMLYMCVLIASMRLPGESVSCLCVGYVARWLCVRALSLCEWSVSVIGARVVRVLGVGVISPCVTGACVYSLCSGWCVRVHVCSVCVPCVLCPCGLWVWCVCSPSVIGVFVCAQRVCVCGRCVCARRARGCVRRVFRVWSVRGCPVLNLGVLSVLPACHASVCSVFVCVVVECVRCVPCTCSVYGLVGGCVFGVRAMYVCCLSVCCVWHTRVCSMRERRVATVRVCPAGAICVFCV